jgi:two-component system OmpR family sensor kinase
MAAFEHYPTVPFHFIWISLTLLYGLQTWRLTPTYLTLVAVCLATGVMLWDLAANGFIDWEEITEVPLMASVFLSMVWQARRRQAALDAVQRYAESERVLRDRERVFSRQASHQLRSPITVARGHAQLLSRETQDPRVIEDAEIVIRELDKLHGIAKQLLELGYLETRETLDLSPCDLDTLVRATVGRWSRVADRLWEVSAQVGEDVILDRDRIEAALDELVVNAVKHTRPGQYVGVTARRAGDQVVLQVCDDGVGIDGDDLSRVFDHFWRGSRRRYHGSGLGLTIVKTVADVHDGHVMIESVPGHGAMITMTLPVTPAKPDRKSQAAEQPASASPPSG